MRFASWILLFPVMFMLLASLPEAATVTFAPSPTSGTYTVPTGVNQITIVTRSGDGGLATASTAFNAGQRATVTTVINVVSGDVVRLVVGSAGANGDLESGGGGGTGVFINGVLSMVAGGGGSGGRPGGGGSYQNTTVAGYVSGMITAGTSGGGAAANGFVTISCIDPQITVSKISNGGTGTFAFSGSNGFGGHNITTATAGAAAAGPVQVLTSPGISTSVTESALPAGFLLTAISCTGMGVGGTATPNLATRTVTFNPTATVSGSNISCTFTNTRATIKFRKITLNGTGGPFAFTSPVNIASAPAAITTVTTGVAEPVAPVAIAITALNSQVQLTEAATSGFFINSANCTDVNSGVTGNTGTISTFAGSTLTISATNVKAGVDFTCTFTNTKLEPAMTVVKTANTVGPVAVGTVITYTFKVKIPGIRQLPP